VKLGIHYKYRHMGIKLVLYTIPKHEICTHDIDYAHCTIHYVKRRECGTAPNKEMTK